MIWFFWAIVADNFSVRAFKAEDVVWQLPLEKALGILTAGSAISAAAAVPTVVAEARLSVCKIFCVCLGFEM
jgi:ABC-type cobalamin transport system permease subunit